MNIPNLTDEQIFEKYKNAPVLYELQDGNTVIGQEVDADNRLIFITNRNGVIAMEYAQNCLLKQPFQPKPGEVHSVVITRDDTNSGQ